MMDDMDDMVDQYEMTIAVEWMVEYILEVRGVPPIRSITIIDARRAGAGARAAGGRVERWGSATSVVSFPRIRRPFRRCQAMVLAEE